MRLIPPRTRSLASRLTRHAVQSAAFIVLLLSIFHTCAQAQTPPPGAPTVSATPGNAKAIISWSASDGANGYYVYKSSTGAAGSFTNIGSGTDTTREDTQVSNGKTYYYRVRAYNSAGTSPYSNTAAVKIDLDPPAGLSARPGVAPVGNSQITLTWGSVQWAYRYQIYASKTGAAGSFSNIGSVNAPDTTYVHTHVNTLNLVNGSTYFYYVKAQNDAGYGQASPQTAATLDLGAPSWLLASCSNGSVTLSWTPVDGAHHYSFSRSSTGPDSGFENINSYKMETTANDSYLVPASCNKTYWYKVWAVNAAGSGRKSAIISTAGTGAPACPPHDLCTSSSDFGGYPGGCDGPSCGDPVDLASGTEAYAPPPDLVAYNPHGPPAAWQRKYFGRRALRGYGSPGLSAGWVHTYDIVLRPAAQGTWGALTLVYYNGAEEVLTPQLGADGQPTGVLLPPPGSPYFVRGVPDAAAGVWQSVTLTWGDQTSWQFTPFSADTYALSRTTNRTGQGNDLLWRAGDRALTQINDAASGSALLTLAYGGDGRLMSVTDAYNRQVVYGYSAPFGNEPGSLETVSQVVAAGTPGPPARWSFAYTSESGQQLKTITVPSATGTGTSTATINYNSMGRVTSLVDANGNQRVYTYDAGHTQVQVKDAANNVVAVWKKNYSADGRGTGATDADNNSTLVEYGDAQNPNRPTRVVDKNGKATVYTFDAFGNPLTVTTPRGVTTTYTYDYAAFPLGRLTSAKEGGQPATTYTYYEPSGLVQSVTGPAPNGGGGTATASYTYDGLGNVLTATGPGNNAAAQITTTFNYTADGAYSQPAKVGQPLTVTDNLGHATHFRYDAQGRVTSARDALGNESNTTYNLAGQTEEATLPATGQTGAGRARRLNSYLYPGGPLTSVTAYDEAGAQVRQVSYAYGKEGEPLAVSGAAEPVTYAYDSLYRLKTLKDGGNNTTTYSYDGAGNLSSVQMPGGDTTQFPSYDAEGNVLRRVDGNGAVTDYVYDDSENNLTDIQYPATPSLNVHFGYDALGRRSAVTDSTGSHAYTYGHLDELLSVTTTYTGLPAQTVSYTYYPDGSRQEMATPAGAFTYSYDGAGRMTGMTNPHGEATAWAYLDNGWLRTQLLSNGALATYTYNAGGQLTRLLNQVGGVTLSDFGGLAYDGAGNRTAIPASLPQLPWLSGVTSYQYDAKDQLTQEQTTRGGAFTDGFGYDPAGNPTAFKGAARTYNVNNQRAGAGFTHDGNGNPTTYAGTSLTFDAENRLTSYGGTMSAGYRSDGARAWKQTAAGRTYFLYDGFMPVVELGADGTVAATNSFGVAGVTSRRTGAQSVFYSLDAQGNVSERLDAGANVLSAYLFAAHGGPLTAPAPDDPFGYKAQWGYYTDQETGLILCTFRYYDPSGGRFLTRDPAGYDGGVNLYAYAANDPVNQSDPTGLWPSKWRWKIHQKITRRALANRASARDIEILMQEQEDFDGATQAEAYANWHAMRMRGQSRAEARRRANMFIRHSVCLARRLAAGGHRGEAMRRLSRAMHTVQDAASPAHANFQVAWEDTKSQMANHSPHYKTEMFLPPRGGVADEATVKIWQYFTGERPMPPDFFGDSYDLKHGRAYFTSVSAPDGGSGCGCQ
jgi:RHS repeat-associated protein